MKGSDEKMRYEKPERDTTITGYWAGSTKFGSFIGVGRNGINMLFECCSMKGFGMIRRALMGVL